MDTRFAQMNADDGGRLVGESPLAQGELSASRLRLDEAQLDEVPLERLEVELASLAAHLAAGEARWLEWLAAYDRREGWRVWGCRSAAHWLNWKCAMSLPAARERVRVARALENLPLTRATFAEGALSYSKVRAITRAAAVGLEADLVSMAQSSTAAQLDRICSGLLRATSGPKPDSKSSRDSNQADAGHDPMNGGADGSDDDDTDDGAGSSSASDPERASAWARQFVSSRSNDDGTSMLTACLTDDAMDLIVAAIDAKVAEIVSDGSSPSGVSRREFIDHRGGLPAIRAQALTAIVTEGGAETTVMVTVPISAIPETETKACACESSPTVDPGSGNADGAEQWSVVARLACECRVNLTLTDDNDKPLSVGRESRTVPKRIRTALELRDHGMCQFPGCGTTRGLHAHHVIPWLQGGPTELDNLILLCSFHHHVIHDEGHGGAPGRWSVQPHGNGFLFRTPTGEPATVEHSRGSVNDLYWHTHQKVGEFTKLEPINGGRLTDLSWITTAAIHNAKNHGAPESNTYGKPRE